MNATDPPATEALIELEFFTPKALHNLAQGITLGLSLLFISTLKALNKPLNNEIVKPFQGRDGRPTRFPACYAGLSYRTPSAYLMAQSSFTHSLPRGGTDLMGPPLAIQLGKLNQYPLLLSLCANQTDPLISNHPESG
jgi:hypothetical protein